jgi:hypothetical protein
VTIASVTIAPIHQATTILEVVASRRIESAQTVTQPR